jgi:hypothetical protein
LLFHKRIILAIGICRCMDSAYANDDEVIYDTSVLTIQRLCVWQIPLCVDPMLCVCTVCQPIMLSAEAVRLLRTCVIFYSAIFHVRTVHARPISDGQNNLV